MPSKEVAKRLKQARQELGLSQFELGVKVGIDEATAKSRISHYETAVNMPSMLTLQKLAEALRKPLSWFICEADEQELLATLHLLQKAERHRQINQMLELLK